MIEDCTERDCAVLLAACRGLFGVTERAELPRILIRLAWELGGTVVTDRPAADVLPWDLSLGLGPEPIRCAADDHRPGSRERLERVMPLALADARAVLDHWREIQRQERPATP